MLDFSGVGIGMFVGSGSEVGIDALVLCRNEIKSMLK